MKIEFLYKELCNLYGDIGNYNYLKACLPNASFIETSLNDTPHFINNEVNFIYMGSMTEDSQIKIINALTPYKEKIKELINNNCIFLLTGNSGEIFGSEIIFEDQTIKGLEITTTITKTKKFQRYNSLYLGTFNDMKIVGYTSRFSHTYNIENPLFNTIKGLGSNENETTEGTKINNLYITNLLGPILVLNPLFTEYLIQILDKNNEIAHKDIALKAYNDKITELQSDIGYGFHA